MRAQDLYLIDAAPSGAHPLTPARVLPISDTWQVREVESPASGQRCEFGHVFMAEVFEADGLCSGVWHVAWHGQQRMSAALAMDVAAWMLARELGLPVPQAAVLIFPAEVLKQALPWVYGSDVAQLTCCGWQAGSGQPAMPALPWVLWQLAQRKDRQVIWQRVAPRLWDWLSCLNQHGDMPALFADLAAAAGVDYLTASLICLPKAA